MLTITLPIGLIERGAAGMPFSTIFETEIPRENQHATDKLYYIKLNRVHLTVDENETHNSSINRH